MKSYTPDGAIFMDQPEGIRLVICINWDSGHWHARRLSPCGNYWIFCGETFAPEKQEPILFSEQADPNAWGPTPMDALIEEVKKKKKPLITPPPYFKSEDDALPC